MAATKWDGSDSPSGLTARAGSSQARPFVAGLSGDESGASADDATETARLLGAGTRSDEHHDGRERWEASEDFEGLPWWKRPSVGFLLVPYALFTLAFGGSVVPKLNLIIDLVCKHYFADRSAADPNFTFTPVLPGGDNRQCLIPDVQKKVATFSMTINVLTGMLSSLTAPKLGALSDRYGRKRMMVVCAIGGIAAEIITILAGQFPDTVNYQWMLLGSLLDGLTGSFAAGNVLSHAYTSDCTPPSKRAVSIGYLHSCLFTGLAFGPLLAGYLVKWTGSLLSIFYILLGCHIFFALFMLFITPESLSRKRQLIAREKYAAQQAAAAAAPDWASPIISGIPFTNQVGDVVHSIRTANPLAPLSILFPTGPGTRRLQRNLLILAFMDMVILGAAMSAGTVVVLYSEYMFGWGNFESSKFISVVSMARVVILLGFFPIVNYFFRTRRAARARNPEAPLVEKNAGADELDIWVLRFALLSDVVGFVGYIFVRSDVLFVVCAMITAFGGLGSATIQAALSKHVPAERVGQLLGAIGLLHSLARIFAPILFNGLYAATVGTFPQAFFVLLAALFGLALASAFFVSPHGKLDVCPRLAT
ncbi:Proton-coupled folate transporter [Madurella mycetomatis]|uniref:Proton-coupled folate transporter n=1 Tax=Madurella mycetomatis TaxID=100816 RepID=A0A175W6W2_9PEZI|nr:Proton-coupled folate transporter [Madurella mycetomatis]